MKQKARDDATVLEFSKGVVVPACWSRRGRACVTRHKNTNVTTTERTTFLILNRGDAVALKPKVLAAGDTSILAMEDVPYLYRSPVDCVSLQAKREKSGATAVENEM